MDTELLWIHGVWVHIREASFALLVEWTFLNGRCLQILRWLRLCCDLLWIVDVGTLSRMPGYNIRLLLWDTGKHASWPRVWTVFVGTLGQSYIGVQWQIAVVILVLGMLLSRVLHLSSANIHLLGWKTSFRGQIVAFRLSWRVDILHSYKLWFVFLPILHIRLTWWFLVDFAWKRWLDHLLHLTILIPELRVAKSYWIPVNRLHLRFSFIHRLMSSLNVIPRCPLVPVLEDCLRWLEFPQLLILSDQGFIPFFQVENSVHHFCMLIPDDFNVTWKFNVLILQFVDFRVHSLEILVVGFHLMENVSELFSHEVEVFRKLQDGVTLLEHLIRLQGIHVRSLRDTSLMRHHTARIQGSTRWV